MTCIFFISKKAKMQVWIFAKEDHKLKATGIVRRIDDLGRIVIPKEIRRTLRIREGDPMPTTLAQSLNPLEYFA